MKMHDLRIVVGVVLTALFTAALCGCSDPGEEMADAVAAGNLAAVKRLAVRHPDSVNAVVEMNDIGWRSSVLIIAVNNRRYAIASYLIANGARFDLRDSMGLTPLQAAISNEDAAMVRLLLRAGAPPNAVDKAGWTALHQAASAGNKPLAKLLLSYGADPKVRDKSGKTPADRATNNGHRDTARLLAPEAFPPHTPAKECERAGRSGL